MGKDKTKYTSIGGQAVMEGVMMRGPSSMAIAVRDADGDIRLETNRLKSKKSAWQKMPVVRGIISFFQSFVSGIGTLMRSADVYGEAEPTKFELWLAKKFKLNLMTVVTTLAMLIGVGFAIGLFVILPTFLSNTLFGLLQLDKAGNALLYSLIAGIFKVIVLVCYLLLVSRLKDIRRTFMYHGAEHKTISCYEKGCELTVENAQKCSTLHNRCGTTFLFFVVFISIIVFAAVQAVFSNYPIIENNLLQIAIRIALLPLVAGLAYELLKFLAKHDSPIWYPLKAPGLALQRITTKPPTDEMVEVAITAFKAVMELESDKTLPEVKFVVQQKAEKVVAELHEKFKKAGIEDYEADTDWILVHVLNISRGEIKQLTIIKARDYERILQYAEERATGVPLQYVLGETEFYGYKIKLNDKVLIPRFDTECAVEKALPYLSADSSVLDLCTGSGCIAVALQKQTGCTVYASDDSAEAIALAKQNAQDSGADISFIQSDMFGDIDGSLRFDLIISNPPYIESGEIPHLSGEVKGHEPMHALDGGADGLKYYRIIAQNAAAYLKDGGVLVLEIGCNQAEQVISLLDGYQAKVHKDMSGNDRVITAKLKEKSV